MKRLTTKLFIASTLLALLGTTQASANDYLRLKNDALTIERKANQMARETKHYRATPQYAQLVCDVDQFISLSQNITDLVANGGSIGRIEAYVNKLDATFLHVEGLFDAIEYNAANGIGVKRGNTAHVKRHLNVVEDCILRMQEDVAILKIRARRTAVRRPVVAKRPAVTNRQPTYYNGRYNGAGRTPSRAYSVPTRPAPKYNSPRGSGRGGVSIGGGSSRIYIRF